MSRMWALLLAASFAIGLAASWERWANPVIDGGREMNQPLRLVEGEALYSDVGHIYGPLSPWLHAAFYRAFGPSLTVLYADGIVSAIAILALVYALGRRIMDPHGAGVATLLVMWLCAFKASGNYIFPYAYSALHGTLFGLVTLALSARAIDRPSPRRFAIAGLAAGVTVLAKTEMGVAALCAGVTAALLAGSEDPAYDGKDPAYDDAGSKDPAYDVAGSKDPAYDGKDPAYDGTDPAHTSSVVGRVFRPGAMAAAFLGAAVALSGGVYAVIAARIGWRTLVFDSWLLAYNMPAPLRYFNASLSGFDHPAQSLMRMSVAFIKLLLLGALAAAIAQFRAGRAERRCAWALLGATAAAVALAGMTTGLDWDRGPFLAIPLVLVVVIGVAVRRRLRLLLLYSVFALVALARVLLHVRSGGAYGSFLLPVSLVIFTYVSVEWFPSLFRRPEVARAARSIALAALLLGAAGTAIAIAERYRRLDTGVVATPRGTLVVPADVADAWNQTLAFIDARTRPGDPIVVLPEGTSLTFLSERTNPMREEIATPGFLDGPAEARAIDRIEAARAPLVLIVNRPTREFGAETFGRDYDQALMRWIASRYTPCGSFGALVRAYCR